MSDGRIIIKVTSAPESEAHIACQDELSTLYVESTGRYDFAFAFRELFCR